MAEDFVQRGASGGVEVQNLGDEVPGGVRDGQVLGEGVAVHLDLFVGGLHVGRLEGRLADDERVALKCLIIGALTE